MRATSPWPAGFVERLFTNPDVAIADAAACIRAQYFHAVDLR